MTTTTRLRRSLLVPGLAAAAVVLAACSADPAPTEQAAAVTLPTSTASSASASPSSAPSSAAAGASTSTGPTTVGTDADDVELEDQDGDGSTVVVEEVDAAEAGWIAITDGSGATLGSAAVPAGENRDVVVTLDAPLTTTTELTAQLHRDDADGAFDPATDPAVTEDDDSDDDDRDDDDLVDDDARYTLG